MLVQNCWLFARLLISEMAGPGAITFPCIAVTLEIFFAYAFTANQATHNWIEVTANWRQVRWEWEALHPANSARSPSSASARSRSRYC